MMYVLFYKFIHRNHLLFFLTPGSIRISNLFVNLTFFSAKQILGAVVDDVIPLDSETSALLQDTLTILCCKVRFIYFTVKNTGLIIQKFSILNSNVHILVSRLI